MLFSIFFYPFLFSLVLWILRGSSLHKLFFKKLLCWFVKVDMFHGFGKFGQPWRLMTTRRKLLSQRYFFILCFGLKIWESYVTFGYSLKKREMHPSIEKTTVEVSLPNVTITIFFVIFCKFSHIYVKWIGWGLKYRNSHFSLILFSLFKSSFSLTWYQSKGFDLTLVLINTTFFISFLFSLFVLLGSPSDRRSTTWYYFFFGGKLLLGQVSSIIALS